MRRARALSVFFILSFLFLSCAGTGSGKNGGKAGKSSQGRFTFVSKSAEDVEAQSDSLASISFSPNDKSVCFEFTNISRQPAVIDWEFAALVLDGAVQKTIHNGAAYATGAFHALPKTTVAPRRRLTDCLYPVSRIEGAGSSWQGRDLFKPRKNWFDVEPEHSISVYLPVLFGSEKRTYRAAWTVIDTSRQSPAQAGQPKARGK